MKFTASILTLAMALATVVGTTAQAKAKSDFPLPIAIVGHTQVISILDLSIPDRQAVDLLRDRERTSSGDFEHAMLPIARIQGGHVMISPNFPDKKALSKGALVYLAQNRSCDQATNGTCLVYWREKGLGAAILVSTITDQDGTVHVLQGEYGRRGVGAASNSRLAERLQSHADAKYVIFTNSRPY